MINEEFVNCIDFTGKTSIKVPTFIMTVGISGAGKSTWAKTYKEEQKKLYKEDIVIVSSDGIREEFKGITNQKVFEIVEKRVKENLSNSKDVIMDATNLSGKRRKNFLKNIERIPSLKICVVIATNPNVCMSNQFLRDRKVPEEVIIRQAKLFEVPLKSEGWDAIFIQSSKNNKISLYDYFLMREDEPHDNHHHTLPIKAHMLAAREELKQIQNDPPIYLEKAVLFHDIGKFFTRTHTDYKGNPLKESAFYNHQNFGAYLMLLDEDDSVLVNYKAAVLVQHHMDFFFMTDEKIKEKVGDKFFTELKILNMCDIRAH